jgi:hypothetical protein
MGRRTVIEVAMKNGFFGAVGVTALCASLSVGQTVPVLPSIPSGNLQSCSGIPVMDSPEYFADSWDSGGPRAQTWFSAEYLLWWIKNGPVSTPLVTTGSLSDAIPTALGQPGTQVLFGNNNLSYNAFSGMRFQAGIALGQSMALEGGYFMLERRAVQFQGGSDSNGNPPLGRPLFNPQVGLEESEGISNPGFFSGQVQIASHSALQGYEANLANTLLGDCQSSLTLLAGFRALNLNEDLSIAEDLVPITPGFLTFQGAPVSLPSTVSALDIFHAQNHFYGGQLGGRWQGGFGNLCLGLTGKVALGTTQELMAVGGASTLQNPGSPVTVPGGVLAVPSNSGRFYRSVFGVVPEGTATIGWKLTENISATVGYNIIYWNSVIRPGNQINRTVNPAQIPTDIAFGNGLGPNVPVFTFHSSDFWAQGINFGLLFRF